MNRMRNNNQMRQQQQPLPNYGRQAAQVRRGGIYNKMRNTNQASRQSQSMNQNSQPFYPNYSIEQRVQRNQNQQRTPRNQNQERTLRTPNQQRTPRSQNQQESDLSIEQRIRMPRQAMPQQRNYQNPANQQPQRLRTLRVGNNIRKQNRPTNQNRLANQPRRDARGQQQPPIQVARPKVAQKPAPVFNPNPSNLPAPIANPTGIPFKQVGKIPDVTELKGLQVKAELQKLGDASRAYSEHLDRMIKGDTWTQTAETSRLSLSERFQQIQGAKPSFSPYVLRKFGGDSLSSPEKQAAPTDQVQNRRQRLQQLRNRNRKNRTNQEAGESVQPSNDIKQRLYASN